MISTGNDIVSLNAINAARTNQHKFYSKILSESEIPLYNEFNLAGIPFETFVWLLWSVKESAYKFLQRHAPGLIFTPVKFVAETLQIPENYAVSNFKGCVEGADFDRNQTINASIRFGENALHSRSIIYDDVIVTVANDIESFGEVHWGVKQIDKNDDESQSKEVRIFLLDRLKEFYEDINFTISKTPSGCPILLNNDIETGIPVSLSHHENFVGYSFTSSGQKVQP